MTETREMFKPRPRSAAIFAKLLLGGAEAHDAEMDAGLRSTLERLRAHVER